MLQKVLQSLGLTETDGHIYTTLLEHGPLTATKLAGQVGSPRPSIYGLLKPLLATGLVTTSTKDGVTLFQASPPTDINQLFAQQVESLQHSQTEFQKLLPELTQHTAAQLLTPRFRLFEGPEGVRHVLKDMLLYSDITTHAFWPIHSMLDALSPDFFRYLNKERIKSRIYTRAIWPANQVVADSDHPYLGSGPQYYREIRVAPKNITCEMGYWVYQNKAAFISSRAEGFGFIIESRELVAMLLTQFELLWSLSTPQPQTPKAVSDVFLKSI